MPFIKMTKSKYPPRLWTLIGYPGSGKSTFAAQMRAPIVVIDADQRFDEVLPLVQGDVYPVSEIAAEHTEPHRIAMRLSENMPGTQVGTIVIDSLTAIIAPRVVQAIVAKDQGETKNLSAAFKDKALAMRELQDSVTRWGTDTLWIYHLHDARDEKGNPHTRATVSATEIIRLTRSINMQLEIVQQNGQRGIKIAWARRGRSGTILWDESGVWKGMPERIESAAYDGLTPTEQDRIEFSAPEVFASREIAIAWAVEHGAFETEPHAANAYDKLKREHNPQTARQMAALWIADVQRRLQEKTPIVAASR